ncbi:MAG: CHAT domain-containing protein [Aphanocapsa sp. GSE-SYN-MK-11-07L]|nr:CHAT domain-containing protein [Aphanocapsa sp. GSE-SYN-MK-11-07L]
MAPFVIPIALVSMADATAIAGNVLSDCGRLTRSLNLSEEVCQGENVSGFRAQLDKVKPDQTEALHQLGVFLRQLGNLDAAEASLSRALVHQPESQPILLSLANVQQSAYRRSISDYQSTDDTVIRLAATRNAIAHATAAMSTYQALAQNFTSESEVFAGLNWIKLWTSLESSIPELKALQQQNTAIANTFIQTAQERISSLGDAQQVNARLSLAESLLQASALNPTFAALSKANATEAQTLAEAKSDLRSLSRAYGIRGQLFSQQGQGVMAIAEFGKASSAALSIRANDLAYKWQWEMAKKYDRLGQRTKALELYSASLSSLQQFRKGMLQINPEIQYDFRDKVEPIYREYMSLLLDSPTPDLQKVIEVNDRLQIAELENYLQCSKLPLTSLVDLPKANSPDAAIYIIRLPKHYAVIIRGKEGQITHQLLDKLGIDERLSVLKQNLQGDRFSNLSERSYQQLFGSLYQALFAPVATLLPTQGTLVINVDSQLQGIPWGILYDGQRYLIERFSIAYSLGAEQTTPKPIASNQLRALVGGLSEQTNDTQYPALPAVQREVQAIESILQTKILLNQKFTAAELIQDGQGFPIIHLASHGQFSSNPRQTYILAWNERITLSELGNLVRSRDAAPLELLVLSACETAQGDHRASLGIAGTAIQSGARSTVATLWLVNDESQSQLMQTFYQSLKQGKSKAEALRDGQLALLHSSTYRSPYFWGSAVLLGSWD